MDNRDILNEAFFKKTSYVEKRQKNMPQYEPIKLDKGDAGSLASGVPSYVSNQGSFEVSDTREVKKRLANTFGVAFGNHNVKSLASRSLKTFPIIVSDHVEPETVVMLKKLMEEQYAEYINLLVSNQIIDLSAYKAGQPTGNIALQALDQISDNNFGKAALADRISARDGFDAGDMFKNVPLYNLLRESEYKIEGDDILSTLLENAIFVPTDRADEVVRYITENYDAITDLSATLNETPVPDTRIRNPVYSMNKGKVRLGDYFTKYFSDDDADRANRSDNSPLDKREKFNRSRLNVALSNDQASDVERGFAGVDANDGSEIYRKLTTADIVVDEKRFDEAINRSVGELLCDPNNYMIRDRFEKATFLLQSRRISGKEYYQYLVIRLGIPVSDKARRQLVTKYRASEIRDYTNVHSHSRNDDFRISDKDRENIEQNRRIGDKIVRTIWSERYGDAIKSGAMIAGGVGLGAIGAASAWGTLGALSLPAAIGSGPLGWAILAACSATGGIAALVYNLAKKRKTRKEYIRTEGWERVEALIEMMDKNQAIINKGGDEPVKHIPVGTSIYKNNDDINKVKEDIQYSYEDYLAGLRSSLGVKEKDVPKALGMPKNTNQSSKLSYVMPANLMESVLNSKAEDYELDDEALNEAVLANINEFEKELNEAFENDEDFRAEVLEEKVLGKGVKAKPVYISKKPNSDVLITPVDYARTNYAYGSVEIERKDNKDRRYNQPLIMTINFKERLQSDKYSDRELTAVIGILGKVIRVPSSEMQSILRSVADGNTLANVGNIISDIKSGDLKNMIGNMIAATGKKLGKDTEELPQSGDTWHNLEKVATLAAANSMSGRKNTNLSNAHIIFSQKEVDAVTTETGVNFIKDGRKAAELMKKYSAFTLMVANDASQRAYIFDDLDNISWNVVPYSALTGKDTGDQLNALVNKMSRL